MKWMMSALLLISLNSVASEGLGEPRVVVLEKEYPPKIWSDHKELAYSESICATKGIETPASLGFTQINKSRHDNYIYGNFSNNRAAIKCLTIRDQTFAYVIVAGAKTKVVEKLRNEIFWQL